MDELNLSNVGQFRSEWKDGSRSSAKKLERMRAFFRFALKRKWIQENPAAELKAPKVTLCPTLPFTPDKMQKIYAAIDNYKDEMPKHGLENARRLPGLILLLRYSGMRISDVVGMKADRVQGNRLFLYTQKTGVPVNTVLPDHVLKTIEVTPRAQRRAFLLERRGKVGEYSEELADTAASSISIGEGRGRTRTPPQGYLRGRTSSKWRADRAGVVLLGHTSG